MNNSTPSGLIGVLICAALILGLCLGDYLGMTATRQAVCEPNTQRFNENGEFLGCKFKAQYHLP